MCLCYSPASCSSSSPLFFINIHFALSFSSAYLTCPLLFPSVFFPLSFAPFLHLPLLFPPIFLSLSPSIPLQLAYLSSLLFPLLLPFTFSPPANLLPLSVFNFPHLSLHSSFIRMSPFPLSLFSLSLSPLSLPSSPQSLPFLRLTFPDLTLMAFHPSLNPLPLFLLPFLTPLPSFSTSLLYYPSPSPLSLTERLYPLFTLIWRRGSTPSFPHRVYHWLLPQSSRPRPPPHWQMLGKGLNLIGFCTGGVGGVYLPS